MRRDDAYRGHIVDAIKTIAEYVGGLDRSAFLGDGLRRDAVVRQLLIIGEAASRISQEFRARHPDIPWRDIVGMRNRIVHDYINVDWDVLWETVEHDLPRLDADLRADSPPG